MINKLLFSLSFFLLLQILVFARQAGDDQPGSLLPDINPQDIEIRGDFRARFAGISRQPILGFNPTPRVFRIDPNRMPFLETPEQVVASVPLAQLEPQIGPPRELKEYPESSRFFGYGGLGMYKSPEARLFASLPFGERSRLHANINFTSMEDFYPDDAWMIDGKMRRFDGQATLRHRVGDTGSLLFNIGGRSDLTETIYLHEMPPGPVPYATETTLNNISTGIAWVNPKSAHDHFEFRATYAYTGFDRDLIDLYAFMDDRINHEHHISAGGSYAWAGNRIGQVFTLESMGEIGLYDLGDQDRMWNVASIGGYWQNDLRNGDRLKIGVRAFAGYDEMNEQQFMGFPYLSYEHRGRGILRFKSVLSGEIANDGLEANMIDFRAATIGGELVNQMTWYSDTNVDFEFNEYLKVHGGFLASYTQNPLMQISAYGNWVHPDALLLLRPSAGISFTIKPRLLTIYGEAHYNLYDLDDDVFEEFYNMEEYRLTAGLRSTPIKNGVAKVWVDGIGPRKQFNSDDTGNALLLNAQVEYRIGGNIGFYIKALNILNQEYQMWDNHFERPLQIYGGATFRF